MEEIRNRIENAQPLLSKTKLGPIAMAHNGTLVNADVISAVLDKRMEEIRNRIEKK